MRWQITIFCNANTIVGEEAEAEVAEGAEVTMKAKEVIYCGGTSLLSGTGNLQLR
jgi:hypothetical protein